MTTKMDDLDTLDDQLPFDIMDTEQVTAFALCAQA